MSEQQWEPEFLPIQTQTWLHALEPRREVKAAFEPPDYGLWYAQGGVQFVVWNTMHGVWIGTRYGGTEADLDRFESFVKRKLEPVAPPADALALATAEAARYRAALEPFARLWEVYFAYVQEHKNGEFWDTPLNFVGWLGLHETPDFVEPLMGAFKAAAAALAQQEAGDA